MGNYHTYKVWVGLGKNGYVDQAPGAWCVYAIHCMGGKLSVARNLRVGAVGGKWREGYALGSCLLGKCLIKPKPPQIIQETSA